MGQLPLTVASAKYTTFSVCTSSYTPHLEPVPLAERHTPSNLGTPIDQVYFVEEGIISLVQSLDDGAKIEAGIIGNEGFVGAPVLLGADSSPLEAMVQIPGAALQMPARLLPWRGLRSVYRQMSVVRLVVAAGVLHKFFQLIGPKL